MTSSWTGSQTLTHGMAMNPAMARIVGKFHKWAQQDAVREEDYEEIEASAFARIGVSRRCALESSSLLTVQFCRYPTPSLLHKSRLHTGTIPGRLRRK